MKIFVSYSRRDAGDFANQIQTHLSSLKYDIFTDVDSIRGGENWSNKIEENISKCDIFVVIVTYGALHSSHVEREVFQAQREKKIIIPCFHKTVMNSDLKWGLNDIQGGEFTNEFQLARDLRSKIAYYNLNSKEQNENFGSTSKPLEETKIATGAIKSDGELHWEVWENLLELIDHKKCIPIIGELINEFFNQVNNQTFVTSKETAKQWAEKYNYPFESPYELHKVASYLAIEKDENYPKDILSYEIRKMKPPDFTRGEFNNSPHKILAELNLPIYITTNYDSFMEMALRSQGKEPVTEFCRWNKELQQANITELIPSVFKKTKYYPSPEKPLVFHLYGVYDYPSSMVLTEQDYYTFIITTNEKNTNNVIPLFLRRELINSFLLFIGYRWDDLTFRSVFQGPLSLLDNISRSRQSLIVNPFCLPEKDKVKKEKIMIYLDKTTRKNYNLSIYWNDLKTFLQELQIKLKEFKKDHIR